MLVMLLACAPLSINIEEQPSEIDEVVQATFVALTVQAAVVVDESVLPSSTPTSTSEPTVPSLTPVPIEATGSIAGQLSYPSSFIPAQTVIAYDDNGYYYYVTTADGQSTYQIDNLPPGNYRVVAYTVDGSLSAGYSQAVPCGLSVECTDNSLIYVTVTSGQVTQGVNPQDWYAPEGSFPAYPLP